MRRYTRAPKIYSSRKYQNPFFHRRRKKVRRISIKTKLLAAAIIVAVAGVTWMLFFNAYFLIDNVVINGSQRIDEHKIYNIIDKQLQKKRLFVFNQQNIFIFSKSQTRKEILINFSVDDLKINKDFPRLLTISFSEKTPAAVWLENEIYYYVDFDFNVLSQVDGLEIDAGSFIILQNENNSQSLIRQNGLGRKVSLEKDYLLFCLELAKTVAGQGLDINNIFKLDEEEKTIQMQPVNGPKIYFNVENDYDEQIKKLKALLSEKINQKEFGELEYIDLRFGDKIYYK